MKSNKHIVLCLVLGYGLMVLIGSIIPAHSANRDVMYRYPIRAYNDGNYRIAVEGFNEFLNKFPDDKKVHQVRYWKAESLMQLERKQDAFEVLISLHKEKPSFRTGDVLKRLAYLGDQLKRADEVISFLDQAVLRQYTDLQNYLIRWRHRSGNKKALFQTLRSIPKDRRTRMAKRFLRTYEQNRILEELESTLKRGEVRQSTLDKLKKLQPDLRSKLLEGTATHLWEQQKYSRLSRLGEQLPEEWTSPKVTLYQAESSVRVEAYDRAAKLYRTLLSDAKYGAEARYSLAWIQKRRGNRKKAVESLEQKDWTEVEGRLGTEALRLLGDLRLDLGQYEQANHAYRRALERSSDKSFLNETRYWLGWSLFRSGNYSDAHKIFNRVAAREPLTLVDVYEARGRTALNIQDFEAAQHNFRRALKFNEDTRRENRLRYELARTLYKRGDMSQAYERLESLINQPLSDELHTSVRMALVRAAYEVEKYERGWSVLQQNSSRLKKQFQEEFRYFAGLIAQKLDRLARATKYYDELLQEYPDSPYSQAALRMSFRADLRQKDLTRKEHKEQLRRKIERSSPQNQLDMLLEWARMSYSQKLWDQASTVYEKVLDQAEDGSIRAEAVDRLVSVDLRRGQESTAEKRLESTFANLPDHTHTHYALFQWIRHQYQNKSIETLRQWTGRYLDRFDDSSFQGHVHFIAGELARRDGTMDKARGHYLSALERDPPKTLRARALFRMGEIRFHNGEYAQAVLSFEKIPVALSEFEASDKLRSLWAEAHYELKNYSEALKLVKAIQDPTDNDRLLRAKLLTRENQLSKASELLSRLTVDEHSAFQAEVSFWKGRLHQKQGNLKAAQDGLYKVLYQYPNWEGIDGVMYHLSQLLEQQGQKKKARSMEERLVSEHPDSSYAQRINQGA